VKDFLHLTFNQNLHHIWGLRQANLRQLDLHLLVQPLVQLRLELHRPRALQGLWLMMHRALQAASSKMNFEDTDF
jgi:hypothetical protein